MVPVAYTLFDLTFQAHNQALINYYTALLPSGDVSFEVTWYAKVQNKVARQDSEQPYVRSLRGSMASWILWTSALRLHKTYVGSKNRSLVNFIMECNLPLLHGGRMIGSYVTSSPVNLHIISTAMKPNLSDRFKSRDYHPKASSVGRA